jgi:6-phosphogluconate dehydrogenase
MNLGIIGLGKMGHAIAHRVLTDGEIVYGFDLDKKAKENALDIGVQLVDSITQLPRKTNLIWLMLPAGELIDKTINEIIPHLEPGTIIIDGGNSNFRDSIRRAQLLESYHVHFLDCGTSGGLKGQEIGFSLMIGGKQEIYEQAVPLFKAIASKNGYGHVGPSGAGHYVKMIHNGIEYAIMQAYSEGFHIIKDGFYKQEQLNLAQISNIWMHGSIIRSYLLELAHDIFIEDQSLSNISGQIAESGMGLWTIEEAQNHNIPAPTIEDALKVRSFSRETGGNFANKIVAMLRNKFGGHTVKKEPLS